MLESKYYKDMNHNYLILKCRQEQTRDKYQLKMITDNKIPGLLSCSTRFINGETYLYYEVNSLQSLKMLYEYKKLNKNQAIRILTGFRGVLREIQTFLLTDTRLLLMPEYIFVNWETEETYFVYYPYEKDEQESGIQVFMEFLIGVIDHQDEQLVDMVYGLCQLAERGRFTAEEIDYYLEGASFADEQRSGSQKATKPGFDSRENEEYDHVEEQTAISEEELVYVPPIEKGQEIKFIITALVSVTGAVAVLYIQNRYLLTSQELLVSWVLLFTFLLILLITGMVYLLLKFSICSERRAQADAAPRMEKEGEEEYKMVNVQEAPAPERYGDTVFLYASEEVRENKLYGMNKGNKYHIDLGRLPCTVGKIAGCTDFCIADASISRMHVKFTGRESAVFMTDLNSTNGTYKNGLRLQPSETVQIEPGDEIRLGKLTFCYR